MIKDYLIVGNKAEYQKWVDENHQISANHAEHHISRFETHKLRGYKHASVIIMPSVWGTKQYEEIKAIQQTYRARG